MISRTVLYAGASNELYGIVIFSFYRNILVLIIIGHKHFEQATGFLRKGSMGC